MEVLYLNQLLLDARKVHGGDFSIFDPAKVPRLPLRYSIIESFGQLHFYELQACSFKIRYHLFNVLEDFNLTISESDLSPSLGINLWEPLQLRKDDKPGCLMPSFRYCIDPGFGQWEANLETGRQYSFFKIHFPESYLSFGGRLQMGAKVDLGEKYSATMRCPFYMPSGSMIRDVDKLLHCPVSDHLIPLYLECVTKALVLMGIEEGWDGRTLRGGRKPLPSV